MSIVIRLIFTFLTIAWASISLAQNSQKNSKVSEVEAYLTQKTVSYINGRFPNKPLLVNITVTPLRRDQMPLNLPQGDSTLPFMSFRSAETIDEWDDPSKSIHDLLPRISSVNARIALPDVITDEEIYELRDALYSNLGLIPGRDQIAFERRNWRTSESSAVLGLEWMAFFATITLIFLVGLTLIIKQSTKSLEEQLKKDGKSAPADSVGPSLLARSRATEVEASAKSTSMGSEIHVNDTLKIAERIEDLIVKLKNDSGFPNLQDMIELEEVAIDKPGFLGAIIQEMPKDMQDTIFRYSADNAWLRVFFEHSPLTAENYHYMLRLSYRKRNSEHKLWQNLLICLWRLKNNLPDFAKTLSQRDALGILAWMPTEISVPTARKAFPGAWGILLKHDFLPDPLPEKLILDIIDKALALEPYRDTSMIDHYNHERGLLNYLRICQLEEERDIYSAAPNDASIHVVRPPFYVIFDSEDSLREELANLIGVRDWATALFNIDRGIRAKITDFLPPKKKLSFIESLKELDRNGASNEQIGLAREKIAKLFRDINIKKSTDEPAKQSINNPGQAKSTDGTQNKDNNHAA